MSNEKKSAAAEEVKEKACELSMEEMEKVTGGDVHCGIYAGDGQMIHAVEGITCQAVKDTAWLWPGRSSRIQKFYCLTKLVLRQICDKTN